MGSGLGLKSRVKEITSEYILLFIINTKFKTAGSLGASEKKYQRVVTKIQEKMPHVNTLVAGNVAWEYIVHDLEIVKKKKLFAGKRVGVFISTHGAENETTQFFADGNGYFLSMSRINWLLSDADRFFALDCCRTPFSQKPLDGIRIDDYVEPRKTIGRNETWCINGTQCCGIRLAGPGRPAFDTDDMFTALMGVNYSRGDFVQQFKDGLMNETSYCETFGIWSKFFPVKILTAHSSPGRGKCKQLSPEFAALKSRFQGWSKLGKTKTGIHVGKSKDGKIGFKCRRWNGIDYDWGYFDALSAAQKWITPKKKPKKPILKPSRFTGVTILHEKGKYRAMVKIKQKPVYCGVHDTDLSGARAINRMLKKHFLPPRFMNI